MSSKDKDFQAGVLWAAAWLCKAHDRPSIAQEMIDTAGARVKDAEDYDKAILLKAGVK